MQCGGAVGYKHDHIRLHRYNIQRLCVGGPKLKCTTAQHGDARHIIMNPIERTSHRTQHASGQRGRLCTTHHHNAVVQRHIFVVVDGHHKFVSRRAGGCSHVQCCRRCKTAMPRIARQLHGECARRRQSCPGLTKRITTYSGYSGYPRWSLTGLCSICITTVLLELSVKPAMSKIFCTARPRRVAPSFLRPRLGRPRTPGTAPCDRQIPRPASWRRGLVERPVDHHVKKEG